MQQTDRLPVRVAVPVLGLVGWVIGFLGTCPLAAAAENDTVPLQRAVSSSGQFVVYSADQLLPHVISVFAEQVRREWRAQLDLDDSRQDSIVIVVRPRRAEEAGVATPHLAFFATDRHLKVQLTWLTPPPLDQASLLRGVVDALCHQQANRRRAVTRAEGSTAAKVPVWLVDGLVGAVRGPDETLREVARRSLAGGHHHRARALLGRTTLPEAPQERRLFQANSWLLVDGLQEVSNGRARLRRFLLECGRASSPAEAFQVVYGDLFTDEVALEKWWAVELTRRTGRITAQNPRLERTIAEIRAVLTTSIQEQAGPDAAREETTVAFENLWKHRDAAWMGAEITAKDLKLEALRQQAVPALRPVLGEYLAALHWLRERRLHRFRRIAREAGARLDALSRKAAAISAYLDQMELVHGSGLPGQTITNVFGAFEDLQQHERTRRNPVSDYLDQFER